MAPLQQGEGNKAANVIADFCTAGAPSKGGVLDISLTMLLKRKKSKIAPLQQKGWGEVIRILKTFAPPGTPSKGGVIGQQGTQDCGAQMTKSNMASLQQKCVDGVRVCV